MCFISIVVPLYNKEHYVERMITSVINQSIHDYEVIIVNDGSTDNSVNVLNPLLKPNMRIIHQEHAGSSAARNRGIRESKGKLIAFLDADDEWEVTFLEKIKNLYVMYPEAGAYGTGYVTILPSGKKLIPKIEAIPTNQSPVLIQNYANVVLGDLPIISSAVAVKKSTFEQVGYFPVGRSLGEDQDMWFRIALQYPIAYDPSIQCIYYRGLEGSMCANLEILEEYAIIQTVREHLEQTDTSFNRVALREYLAKLQLDYAKRLYEAGHIRKAIMLIRTCRTKEFLLQKQFMIIKLWLKKLIAYN
ncbi:glycosyltransferase family 2 protein [Bacillus alkalicellulosilyticus]|uniref:glycosyltransferase family 2 protein n=1 Tax=Alkalihalobacterium alkalicellulosilyticum TaxID=1912214 RepID=UPI0009971AE1|nr:glycosyltransferase family A protein [Bacillus alkalicellulosilyticus]